MIPQNHSIGLLSIYFVILDILWVIPGASSFPWNIQFVYWKSLSEWHNKCAVELLSIDLSKYRIPTHCYCYLWLHKTQSVYHKGLGSHSDIVYVCLWLPDKFVHILAGLVSPPLYFVEFFKKDDSISAFCRLAFSNFNLAWNPSISVKELSVFRLPWLSCSALIPPFHI